MAVQRGHGCLSTMCTSSLFSWNRFCYLPMDRPCSSSPFALRFCDQCFSIVVVQWHIMPWQGHDAVQRWLLASVSQYFGIQAFQGLGRQAHSGSLTRRFCEGLLFADMRAWNGWRPSHSTDLQNAYFAHRGPEHRALERGNSFEWRCKNQSSNRVKSSMVRQWAAEGFGNARLISFGEHLLLPCTWEYMAQFLQGYTPEGPKLERSNRSMRWFRQNIDRTGEGFASIALLLTCTGHWCHGSRCVISLSFPGELRHHRQVGLCIALVSHFSRELNPFLFHLPVNAS